MSTRPGGAEVEEIIPRHLSQATNTVEQSGNVTDRSLRVLIADDHPVFRHGLCSLLEHVADIEVVGEVGSGADTIVAASSLAPHVIVMDLHQPHNDRIKATLELGRTLPNVGVLILTMDQDNDLIFAAIRAGARGYLLKEATGEDIIRAVRAVARGEAVFGPRIADRLIEFFSTAVNYAFIPFPQLTSREHEILDLVASGLQNSAIARRLTLSEKTICNRVSDIYAKLSVTSRAAAIVAARTAGLGAGHHAARSSR